LAKPFDTPVNGSSRKMADCPQIVYRKDIFHSAIALDVA